MNFSLRDLLWLLTLLVTSVVTGVFGFSMGDMRKRTTLELENAAMKSEQFMDRGRIEALEDELKRAGIPIPEKD